MASLQELGAEVAKLCEALGSQLKAGNHPEPSFAVDGPERYPHDPAIQMSRFQLLDKIRDLLYLTTGPADFAFMEVPLFVSRSNGPPSQAPHSIIALHSPPSERVKETNTTKHFQKAQHDVINLNVLNEFDFFGIVPVEGGASYAEIAEATRLPEELVRRLLRYSFTMRVFAPDGPDRVAHTPFSAYVARNPMLKSWIGHNGDECRTAGLGFVRALREFTVGKPEVSQEIDEGGFSMIMPRRKDGSRTDFWKAAEDEPWRVKRFAEAMQVTGMSAMVSIDVVIDSFDWAGLGNATVVDVGGSDGHIMVPVARKHPSLDFVVQDLPRLEPDFKKFMAGAASDVAPRFAWQAHDFFKPQPALPGGKEADLYFLKHVLHDWPEKYAVKILQGLVPALKKPGARILLCDSLIPPLEEAGHLPKVAQKGMAMADMQMMMMFNAQERTPDIYARVVAKADPRLKIKNMISIPGALMSLIELALE